MSDGCGESKTKMETDPYDARFKGTLVLSPFSWRTLSGDCVVRCELCSQVAIATCEH